MRLFFLTVIFLAAACNTKHTSSLPSQIIEKQINCQVDSVNMHNFLVYPSNLKSPVPAIIIVPEWWGLGDYVKGRARQLAQLGYVVMAMDIYGNGAMANDPAAAGALAMPFYSNPELAKARFLATIKQIKELPDADSTQIGAMGYCFGGAMCLNMARINLPLKGVVSFHGNLVGVPPGEYVYPKILVCHGASDSFIPATEIDQFKNELNNCHADYEFVAYAHAVHAFTNPLATDMGKKFGINIAYNQAADSASWQRMQLFFTKIFVRKAFDSKCIKH